jgi:4-amino-4-deoxy-L-arabinose transferase-like glycosyltransferase
MEGPGAPEGRGGGRLLAAVALAVSLAAALLGQHDRQLWAPDEAREAGITQAMARSGDYVVPRLNGRPFLEKPPLFHAAGAAVLDATGSRSPFAVRLPAALFGLATLAATFALGRRIGGTRLGALGALALATTAGFFTGTHRAVTDNAIPPFVTLAFLGLASLQGGGAPGAALALAGASTGVAFLAKGAVGPAMIAAGWGAALLWARDGRRLLDWRAAPALLLALLPAVAWLLALRAAEGAGAVETVLLRNNWDRASDVSADHAEGPFYYLLHGPQFLLPWIPLAALGALRARREGGLLRIPAAWLGAGLLLLTLVAAKRPIYVLPLAPAAALLAAAEIEAVFFRSPAPAHAGVVRAAVAALAVLALAIAAGLDSLQRPGDLPLAAAAFAAALAGALAIRRHLALARPAPALAVAFLLVAGAYAVGFRALGPAGDVERGLDALAEDVEAESPGRELVLFRPSEALEGFVSFRMGREIAVARNPAELAAAGRRWDRELLVVGKRDDPRLPEALGAARVLRHRRAARTDYVIAVLPR